MLKQWLEKFPQSFLQFKSSLNQLTKEQQKRLSNLFEILETAQLLDQSIVDATLSRAPLYLSELEYLIKTLVSLNGLDRNSLDNLFAHDYFSALQEDVERLLRKEVDHTEAVPFLLKAKNSTACVDFIDRALAEEVEFDEIKLFLETRVASAGLAAAITLFDLSSFNYRKEHFRLFAVTTTVLANPLCRTIFDARLRSFSDYAEPSEPLDTNRADLVLISLKEQSDEEVRVQCFFDTFVKIKPFPPSQKYIVDVDVAKKVTQALERYCYSQIKQINNQEQYVHVREMINSLRKKGGNEILFAKIRFEVASEIEEEDLCSTLSYQELMQSIRQALLQPQTKLSRFEEALRQSKGYQEFEAAAIRNIIQQGSVAHKGVKRTLAQMDDEVRHNADQRI